MKDLQAGIITTSENGESYQLAIVRRFPDEHRDYYRLAYISATEGIGQCKNVKDPIILAQFGLTVDMNKDIQLYSNEGE